MFTTSNLSEADLVNSPFRARYRRLALAVWYLLLVLTTSLYIIRQLSDGPYGKDFTIFLTGAHILTSGQASNLYDLATQTAFQHTIEGPVVFPGGVLPFNYPPYVAALFVPLTPFSPDVAYYVWVGVQWVLAVVWLWSVFSHFRKWHQATPAPVFLTLFSFTFVYEAFLMGQMSLILLMLWWWAFVNWREGKWTHLGVVLALAAFKPQMALLLVVALIVEKRWRAVIAALVTQGVLWLGAVLAGGFGIITSYLDMLKLSATTTDTLGFYPIAMPNLRGLLTNVGVDSDLSLKVAVVMWVASLIAVGFIWRLRWPVTVRFGMTTVLAVLFSPHLYIHDASLLVLAVICAQLAYMEQGVRLSMRVMLLPFIALFLATYSLVLSRSYAYASINASVWFFGGVVLVALVNIGRKGGLLRKMAAKQPASVAKSVHLS